MKEPLANYVLFHFISFGYYTHVLDITLILNAFPLGRTFFNFCLTMNKLVSQTVSQTGKLSCNCIPVLLIPSKILDCKSKLGFKNKQKKNNLKPLSVSEKLFFSFCSPGLQRQIRKEFVAQKFESFP